jgi:hypothetical protein
VKYVILIHANPDPWGHPSSRYTPEGRALPAERHDEMDRQFEALLEELSASGEFVTAEALADPASATIYGWSPEGLEMDGREGEARVAYATAARLATSIREQRCLNDKAAPREERHG